MNNNQYFWGPPYPLEGRPGEKPITAVFWDAENVTSAGNPRIADNFDSWLDQHYTAKTKFAFADWSGPYREVGNELYRIGFDLIHVPDHLKDSVDCQMASYIIDWLLRSPETMAYVIVSGDAVFEPIVNALQKQGKTVTTVSDPLITRPETIIRTDVYEDIDRFKPKIIEIGFLEGEKKDEKSPDSLKEIVIRRIQETIARLTSENKPTYRRYVEAITNRHNPDVTFGRPGFYDWDEAISQAIFDGILIIEGDGATSQLRLTDKIVDISEDQSDATETALKRLKEIVMLMYEKEQFTGMESVVAQVREEKLNYNELGFVKFGDFVKAAEGRDLVRIEEQKDRPPIVKPVYSTSEMRKWYEENIMKFFGKGAKVPQPRFIQRSIQFLYKYDISYTKLESYLKDNKIQKVYDSILEASGVSFIPPYERVILFILLGTGHNIKESLEVVNKEMAPLGYELKCPS